MISYAGKRGSIPERVAFERLRSQETLVHLDSKVSREAPTRRPWEVARWGRLLAGAGVLLFTALSLLHHPAWLAGTLAVAGNLVVTALTDHCVMRNQLLRLGAKEREDLYLPGGAVREEHGRSRLQASAPAHSFERTPSC